MLEEVYRLMPLPLKDLGIRSTRYRTLGDFYVRPVWEAFERLFIELSYAEKERVLQIAADVANYPDNPHLRLLWPGLNHTVAADLREVIHGLARSERSTQEEFVESVRQLYLASILKRSDALVQYSSSEPEEVVLDDPLVAKVADTAKSMVRANVRLFEGFLPTYTETICLSNVPHRGPMLAQWAETLSVAVEALCAHASREGSDPLAGTVATLEQALETCTAEPLGDELRLAVLNAFAWAPAAPAAPALRLDKFFWEKRVEQGPSDRDREIMDKFHEQWNAVHGVIRSVGVPRGRKPAKVRMNASPYAEYTWQLVFRLLARVVMEVRVDLVCTDWEYVADEFQKNNLDIAFHNTTFLRRCAGLVATDVEQPLFLYRGYELIVGWRRFEQLLNGFEPLPDSIRVRLKELQSHQSISESDLDDDEDLREVGRTLFENAKIRFPLNTDMQEALETYLERTFRLTPGQYIKSYDVGTGIEALLDGEIDVLLAGNNDARYVASCFPGRALVIHLDDGTGEVDFSGIPSWGLEERKTTRVYSYPSQTFYSQYPKIVQGLNALWGWVPSVWNVLVQRAGGERTEALRSALETVDSSGWREEMELHLWREFNRGMLGEDNRFAGFVDSFRTLEDLVSRHNRWLDLEEPLRTEARTPPLTTG